MRYLYLPLFLLAVLLPLEIAHSAEPPATCKLKLIRLQPVMAGKPWPENERFERFARSVYFRRDMENNVLDKASQKAERDFRIIVKREPKEYHAAHPRRAVLVLGDNKYALVLDKQSKKSVGYDRLYFDLNGNNDLTDDPPIDVPDAYKTADSVKTDKGWTTAEYRFPRLDFKIRSKGKEWDYSLFLTSDTTIHDKQETSLWARFIPAAYRQGEITLQGKNRQIALVDWNVSGRFDVPISFASDGKGSEDFLGQYGTEILFDKDVLIHQHLPIGYMSEHRQFLAKMNALGGRFYEISVTPGGDELTCTPVSAPMGKIVIPHVSCNLWLINEQGLAALDLQKDTPADIPAGNWRLLYCTFWQPAGKGITQPDATGKASSVAKQSVLQPPTLIHLSAFGGLASEPIAVVADRTATLKIGPPFTPTLTVERRGDVALLNLEIRGIGHEKVDCQIAGIKQSKQKLRITNSQGDVVEQGSFEYG